jgi:SAM-dependent methyltransferase
MNQTVESSTHRQQGALDAPLSHNVAVAEVWDAGGDAYNEISRSILDAIEHCVNRLRPGEQEHILDVATGTGWAARRVAEWGANVTGIDISGEELKAARGISRRMGLDIDFRLADVEALPFDKASFDGIISTCGVMFASRPEDAAAELVRVCRPGGRIALITWTPDGNVFEMFRIIKGYMAPPSDPAKAPPSPFEWGRTERVRELLGRDFELHFEEGVSYYREPDGETAWNTFYAGYGPVRKLASTLDEERKDAFRRNFVDFHEQFRTSLGICVPREYLLVYGVRR